MRGAKTRQDQRGLKTAAKYLCKAGKSMFSGQMRSSYLANSSEQERRDSFSTPEILNRWWQSLRSCSELNRSLWAYYFSFAVAAKLN